MIEDIRDDEGLLKRCAICGNKTLIEKIHIIINGERKNICYICIQCIANISKNEPSEYVCPSCCSKLEEDSDRCDACGLEFPQKVE